MTKLVRLQLNYLSFTKNSATTPWKKPSNRSRLLYTVGCNWLGAVSKMFENEAANLSRSLVRKSTPRRGQIVKAFVSAELSVGVKEHIASFPEGERKTEGRSATESVLRECFIQEERCDVGIIRSVFGSAVARLA